MMNSLYTILYLLFYDEAVQQISSSLSAEGLSQKTTPKSQTLQIALILPSM